MRRALMLRGVVDEGSMRLDFRRIQEVSDGLQDSKGCTWVW
jgi:hypothetical protein